MFAAGKSTLGTPTSIGDPFFNHVTLLLQGDGTNGAKNNTFLNSAAGVTTFVFQNVGFNYSVDGFADSTYPDLTLVRGQTYYFNFTNVTSTHPIALRLSNGNTATVPGTTGNDPSLGVYGNGTNSTIVTYQVPLDAPATIYYQCRFHAGMIGTVNIIDPITITRNGNPTQGSFSPYGSNWSNYFDKNGDYLTAPTPVLSASGDFTIECWINAKSSASNSFVLAQFTSGSGGRTGFGLGGNTVQMFLGGSTNNGTTNIPYGSWTHLAFTRSGTTFKAYVNGTLDLTVTSSVSIDQVNTNIGGDPAFSPALYFGGYISNMRVTNTVVYTGNFTPSTTPLTAVSGTRLLTCQSNRFIDNSTNNYTLTVNGDTSVQRFNPFGTSTAYSTSVIGGSGYFDGTGDYLSTPSTSNLSFGSGDFTIEAWVYANALDSYNAVFAQWPDNGGTVNNSYTLETVGSSMYFYWASSAGLHGPANLGTIETGEWTHYAICRSGNTLYPFKNGVLQTTVSITETLNSPASAVTVGGQVAGGGYWNGFISNLRVVKGSAVYTNNFTPPTSPVTAITNTQLLTNFTNGAIFDNAMMNDLETVGTAGISTSVKKYGTGSISIGSTQSGTDYLTILSNGGLYALTGDFTVEFWLYKITSSQYGPIIETRTSDDTVSGIYLMDYNSTFVLYPFYELAPSIETATWIHFAAVRSGNTLTIYKNGVSAGSTACNTSTYKYDSGARLSIGAVVGFSATRHFNGYIDDLRITRGVARYLTNFTPPAAALPVNG